MTLPGSTGCQGDNSQVPTGFPQGMPEIWSQTQSLKMSFPAGPSGVPYENPQFPQGIYDLWPTGCLPYPGYPFYPYQYFPGAPMQQPQQLHNGFQTSELPQKKGRISFSKEQIAALEARFQQDKHIRKPEREAFARMWGLKPEQVKIWFQNQRYKRRKQEARDSTDGNSEDGSRNVSYSTSNETSTPSTPENSSSNLEPPSGSSAFVHNPRMNPQLDFMTPLLMNQGIPGRGASELAANFHAAQPLMSQNGVPDNQESYPVAGFQQWSQFGNQFFPTNFSTDSFEPSGPKRE